MTLPLVGVVMGSASDWDVMKAAVSKLVEFGIPYDAKVASAHRSPELLAEFLKDLEHRGAGCIIAGAGGAAHLPGVVAAATTIPVLGVPMPSKHLQGLDSLLSIVQMPGGIPVATFGIGEAGAQNAALFVVALYARTDSAMRAKLTEFRKAQEQKIRSATLPSVG